MPTQTDGHPVRVEPIRSHAVERPAPEQRQDDEHPAVGGAATFSQAAVRKDGKNLAASIIPATRADKLVGQALGSNVIEVKLL